MVYIDNQKDFECIYVSPHATDTEIIQHREISVKLDMTGVGNRGLFLKLRDSEQPFGLGESPCDVLFEMNINGELRRLPVGEWQDHAWVEAEGAMETLCPLAWLYNYGGYQRTWVLTMSIYTCI